MKAFFRKGRAYNFAAFVLILLLVASVFAFSACKEDEPPEPTPDPSSPLLWTVTGSLGERIYLFGTIHCAQKTLYPLPDYIMNAFNSCGSLAVEFDTVAFEKDFAAQIMMTQSLVYTGGKTVAMDIGADLHQRSKDAISSASEIKLGFPVSVLDGYKPYMWTSVLSEAAVKRAGLSYDYAVDSYLLKEAKKRGKTILEIETMQEQLDMLLGFSMPLQIALLEDALDIDGNAEGISKLYDMWKGGNKLSLSLMLGSNYEYTGLDAEYNNAVMKTRNIKMLNAAMQYLSEGKRVFLAVGLAHMLGSDGLVAQLYANGYNVMAVSA